MTVAAGPAVEVEGHPKRWWALVVLCLTLGMVALDNSVLNVALPHIADELNAGESRLQWVTTAYGLVLAGLLLPFAVVGDRWSRKGLLVSGLALFGVASALAAQAPSSGMLVVARGFQGIGGAAAMPATLSLLSNIFPEHERARAIAIWSATAGVAAASGPIVGGLLLSRFWWGSVFIVNVPVAAIAIGAAVVLVPESRDAGSPRVDRRSAAAWWASLTCALLAIIEAPQQGLRSPVVLTAGAGAVALFVLFRAQEARTDGPLVDADTASDPRMLGGAATMGALFLALFGSQFVVTQWLQGPHHLTAIAAGLCFVPGAVASIGTPLLNPPLVRRWGHGVVAGTGLGIVTVGALGVAVAIAAHSVAGVVMAFSLFGCGVGLASPSGAELIMSSAPPARAGSAAGVNETIVEAAGALGVGLLGSALVGGHWARPLPMAAAITALAGTYLVSRRRVL